MKVIKPKHADITLEYECPVCETSFFMTVKQTRTVGRYNCWCGALVKVKPIEHVTLKVDWFEKEEKSLAGHYHDAAIGLLKGYGYTTEKAINLVSQALLLFKCDDLTQLVKNALRLDNDPSTTNIE